MRKKHKNENVFKFKNFSERISEVDLRSLAFYRIEHVNELPDENRSYFSQCREKWSVLNLTQEYGELEKKLKVIQTSSLPQVLHHKDKVIEVLLERLENATDLSLQPVLELTVALARDLREEFYAHFPKFFELLINLLKTKNADQTEWTLVCLACLFKILKSFLCKEMTLVIKRILPLLSEKRQPEYIINFSVECLAFIVRNLKDKNNFIMTLLAAVEEEDSYVMGCGKLFFEMMKGVSGQFHSKGGELLMALFEAFEKEEYEKYHEILKEILIQTIDDIMSYIDARHMDVYWNVLLKVFESSLKDPAPLNYLLHFVGQSIEFYGGKKVTDIAKVINLLIQLDDEQLPLETMIKVSQIASVILLSKNFTLTQLDASRLTKKITGTTHAEVFETFVMNSIDCSMFEFLIMPDFVKYFEQEVTKEKMEMLAKIIEHKTSNELLDCGEFNAYTIYFKKKQTAQAIIDKIYSESDEEFLLAIQIYPHITSIDKEKVEKHLMKKIEELNDLKDVKNLYLLAVCLTSIKNIKGSLTPSKINEILQSILKIEQNFASLQIIKFLLELNVKKDSKLFAQIRSVVARNLTSKYHKVRLVTSQILSSFDNQKLYTTFKQIEEIEPTIQTYRDQILLLQKLNFDHCEALKDKNCAEDAVRFSLGFLHVNFQPLWETIQEVIESYAANLDFNTFWPVYINQLKSVINEKEEEIYETESEFFNERIRKFTDVSDRYDAIAYRVKLLKILSDTKTTICDTKHRDIVETFYNFYDQEYQNEDEKGRQKLLICHLQVLAKFTNPKCVARTNELRKLYIELLQHRNFQVQKIALECILNYKEPAVANFKEILTNCVNEKTFRSEIISLNLNEKVSDEFREGFSEIFLPILYSKLTIKAGKNDQEGFHNKKEVIIRFMNHLKEEELTKLTEISTQSIQKIEKFEDVKNLENLKVNELQSILQFVDLLRKNVAGAFSENYQKKILSSILSIACYTLDKDGAMFKSLKQSCLQSVTEFFAQFESFVWDDKEIDLIFEIFINQHLETFARDASQNVTTLMKLFVEWSKNPSYFKYLEKCDKNGNYPLKSIIKLLSNESTTASVTECVMDIVERLLTLISSEEVITTVNYGTTLIQPFILDILMKLKTFLNIKRVKSLSDKNLFILSRITELVDDQESSKVLLDIMIPLTLKKSVEDKQDSEGIMKLLQTISNLLKVIGESSIQYLRAFVPLFETINEVNQRKFLVKIFAQVTKDEKLIAIVNDLNAFDRRWIEQPDYERKLSAFHRIEKEAEISIDWAVIVIYHCFYFLKYEKDLGIRDNSSHHLKMICGKVIGSLRDDKTQIDYFMDKILLNLIRKRIGESDLSVKTEAIQLLGELSRNYQEIHPVLRDLHALTSSSNRELDFFDNITHLQKFRHMKALRRFVEIGESLKQPPNLRTLNDFLLPLSKIFLCSEEYKRKTKVIEAAIEFVSCICKFLPWNQYEIVLKHYIRKMRGDSKAYQKQLVKLIPAILDSFHFEFSEVTQEIPQENVNENIEEDDDNESSNDDEEETEEAPISHKVVLSPNASQRVIKSLMRNLIPSLFRIINELSTNTAHKANKEEKRLQEKADMIRIPLAVPLIRLLKKLPAQFLKQYMSQCVLKVSSFLKSTLKQVRATARHTLKEVLVTLGVEHLEVVIENLSAMLCKGFYCHVLSITVHTLIDALKTQLTTEVADKILQKVLDICMNDIFGRNNEEQEVSKIGNKTPEAKPSRKSFLTLSIMASNVSEKCILDLLMPFKQKLLETTSKKNVTKIQECLVQIAAGFTANTNIPDDALMILIHGTISESIPNLLPEKKQKSDSKQIKRNDCFILQAEPKRRGALSAATVKSSKQTNTYVLVEFGLEMLHIMMKKKRFVGSEQYFDPLVPLLLDSLKSNHTRVSMFTVRCVSIMWHHQLDLENLKINTEKIATEIFSILHKYATTEISQKDNHYLLTKSCFKAVLTLLRHVEYYTLNSNQLKALLLYIEQDLSNANDKDTICFVLLKAILDRKLIIPEVAEIMRKVAEISITSEIDERRNAIRPIVLTYLMDYPLGKKIDALLKFFIAQLNYDEISGRESAIAMLSLIFRSFPKEQLEKQAGLFFLALGTRLISDESPVCREKIAEAIELLITQLPNNSRQQNFDIMQTLLSDKKLVHREMAAQLSVRFLNACSSDFMTPKISNLLELLLKSITYEDDEPGKFVRMKRQKLEDKGEEDEMIDERDQQTIEDHHLYQTLHAISKFLEYENVMKNIQNEATISEIGFKVHQLISHDHMWVRLKALKIINVIIKNANAVEVQKVIVSDEIPPEDAKFLHSKSQIQSLTFDMAVQLKPNVEEELLEAINENLLEIAKILKNIPITTTAVNDKKDFNLVWLIRRLRYAVHAEIATAPSSFTLRKSIFNFFNILLDVLDKKLLMKLASSLLTPMLREMVEGEHVIEELKQVAMQVGNRIKAIIGLQEYDKIRLELQSKLLRKRVDRRKALAQEKIKNPAKAATRNIMKQLKKQDKKRKRKELLDGIIPPRKKRKIFGNNMKDTYE